MAINSPYRIGTDPSGKDTEGKFYMSSEQSARWGDFHNAYDLVGYPFVTCTCGQPDYECKCNAAKTSGKYKYPQKMIYSTIPGKVIKAGWQNSSNHEEGFGLYVCIQSSISGQTHYYHYFGHLCEIATGITVGKTVSEGTFLGIEGSTGSSTGSHVHYEIRPNQKKATSASDANFVSLADYTGIPNAEGQYYQDTRRADGGGSTPDTPVVTTKYGTYIGGQFYGAHIYTSSGWKRATPMIWNGSKWVKCKK